MVKGKQMTRHGEVASTKRPFSYHSKPMSGMVALFFSLQVWLRECVKMFDGDHTQSEQTSYDGS